MKPPISELAWHLIDYLAAGIEPPARCVSHPDRTEGEMMSEEEIEEFTKDSIATLRILSDRKSSRYATLAETFRADLSYLLELGQISDDDYNDLTNRDNLHF